MAASGFEIPAVPDSFGDGSTPVPLIPSGTAEFQNALSECPLDLEGVDLAVLEAAATAAAREAHGPETTFDPETCASLRAASYSISEELITQVEMFMREDDPETYNSFSTSEERRQHIRSQLNASHEQSLVDGGC
jgi:hypothetical protein